MLEMVNQYTQVAMNIAETTEQLEMRFNITGKGESVPQPLRVMPSALVSDLKKHTDGSIAGNQLANMSTLYLLVTIPNSIS